MKSKNCRASGELGKTKKGIIPVSTVYGIGDFALHIDFLRRCGVDGELSDILIDPRRTSATAS